MFPMSPSNVDFCKTFGFWPFLDSTRGSGMVYICVHFCIFVYISVYSHVSSKDAPHDLRQNERLSESHEQHFSKQL